jgi:FAD/FMN-containing dehydrogenase
MSEPTTAVSVAALAPFSEAFQGEIVLPGSAGYDAARIVWNGMIDRRPAVVARCEGVDDIARAIRFARDQGLPIAVRSGGHSVGGFSTCDDGLVIDLSLMRGVRVDPEQRTAQVNGGTLLGDLDREAQAFGLACPVGVVGHTGVAGLTLGGGMGRLQRRFGFTIDNLLSVDLVTADGELLHVSESEHPDLFWGMRGAGPNFGVVTSFEFRLHEVGPDVVQGTIAFPAARAHEVADRFREYLDTAPDEEALSFAFVKVTEVPPFPPGLAGQTVVLVGATHSGAPDDARDVLRSLRDAGPLFDAFDVHPYLKVQALADEDMAWGKRFSMKGGFLAALSEGFVDLGIEQITVAPGTGCWIGLWAQGGAIARVADDAMAFTGREAPFWLGVEAAWDDPSSDEVHREWGQVTMDSLKPFTAEGHYVNDLMETGEDVARGVYGDAKYDRLVELKRVFDPDNVFRLNQNIRP